MELIAGKSKITRYLCVNFEIKKLFRGGGIQYTPPLRGSDVPALGRSSCHIILKIIYQSASLIIMIPIILLFECQLVGTVLFVSVLTPLHVLNYHTPDHNKPAF